MQIKLSFPNPSRTYNGQQRSIRFTGHFAIFEITFDLDQAVLARMSPGASSDEAALLGIFDANRPKIEAVANAVYWRMRKDYCRLSAKDF
ncbi:MAG: DUF1488 domain-containing protein [Rhodomicrobium sp.]|nr:DUF1488 domain-containing protein [Rhodomicrobium sp.]